MPTHLSDPPLTPAITSPGIVFSFHDYCVFSQAVYLGLPEMLVEACTLHQGKTWSNYDRFHARAPLPAMVTEFGDTTNEIVLAGTLTAPIAACWAGTTGTTRVGRTCSRAHGASQLVRTYPQATAGVPRTLSYDTETGCSGSRTSRGPRRAHGHLRVRPPVPERLSRGSHRRTRHLGARCPARAGGG